MVGWWAVLLLASIGNTAFAQEAEIPSRYRDNPQAMEEGRQHFLDACSACHGPNGEGGVGPSLVNGREVRRATDERLFDSIQKGVPGSDMPPFDWPEDQIWKVVAFVRSLSAPAIENPPDGDAAVGRELFFGKAGCATCHRIRGRGGVLGPDLTAVGAIRRLDQIREAIVAPNDRITEGYTPVELTLANGTKKKAVAKNYSNYSAQILDAGGRLHLLRGQELKRMRIQETSWMPADYAERLSEQELAGLLAFLSRQAPRDEMLPTRNN